MDAIDVPNRVGVVGMRAAVEVVVSVILAVVVVAVSSISSGSR